MVYQDHDADNSNIIGVQHGSNYCRFVDNALGVLFKVPNSFKCLEFHGDYVRDCDDTNGSSFEL